jgi:hypothetical protein
MERSEFMDRLHTLCARVALAAAAAAVSGCASEPIAAGTSLAAGLISATTEVAIVTGRTITNVVGIGIETVPPQAAAPAQPSLPK